MRSKKSQTKLADTASQAAAQAKVQAAELQDRIGPAVSEARDRIAPMVEDARGRLTPVVEDARDRLAPVVEDAKGKIADLAENVATKLDDSLPDKATPTVVKDKSADKKGGKLRKLLLVAGIGTAAAVVAKRLRGSSEPQWQSAPSRPTPVPQSSGTGSGSAAAAAATATGTSGSDAAKEVESDDAAGGGSPDEAASDATDVPHQPSTPDNPAETVEIKKD